MRLLPAGIVPAPFGGTWQPFGVQHLLVLFVACVLSVNLFVFRKEAARIRLDVWLVASMALLHICWIVFALTTGIASPGDLLPLYTCDASIIAGAIWCFRKPLALGQILFYWSFLGGLVTLLLPDTFGYSLPHFAAVYTLAFHVLLLLLGLEIWLVEGVRPTWGSLVPVIAATAVLIPPSIAANAAFGSDYMFVSRDPGGVFSFLNDFNGVPRIGLTLASALGILFAGLLAWFGMDLLLRRSTDANTIAGARALAD